ncbi:MAG: phospholipase D-like domain-containing protein [Myxococcota bacterium]|jgi:phosphatidylserine/phosphatidylglycerophosphate/cardiolipin synthase-like enzyme|nr:phospholipase D-like domain-containing protein [Myxococcota bacterium]
MTWHRLQSRQSILARAHAASVEGASRSLRLLFLALLSVLGSSACSGPTIKHDPGPAQNVAILPMLELVESWPLETSLDDPAFRDAAQVWVQSFDGAQESIELSEFYAISAPGSAMEPVVESLLAAAERDVKVRLIVDTKLLKGNEALPELLDAHPNIEVRYYDLGALMGGVQHSKYFVVDGKLAFLGSQNFDYRSLEHVRELGVLIRLAAVVKVLRATFEYDWALAGGAEVPAALSSGDYADACGITTDYGIGEVEVCAALSPKGFLVDEALWDLPKLIEMIAQAQTRISVQLLDFSAINYDKSRFDELESALLAAAQRGVQVQLMVGDWAKRPKTLTQMIELQKVQNFTVKFVTIPQHSSGFIPHARVIHAKTMVVDGKTAWVGTSNWSGDYFYKSRNVGIIVEGETFAADVQRFFDTAWNSEYAEVVDPQAQYEAPRIKE